MVFGISFYIHEKHNLGLRYMLDFVCIHITEQMCVCAQKNVCYDRTSNILHRVKPILTPLLHNLRAKVEYFLFSIHNFGVAYIIATTNNESTLLHHSVIVITHSMCVYVYVSYFEKRKLGKINIAISDVNQH